jgi:histidine triad (HIT) family protein
MVNHAPPEYNCPLCAIARDDLVKGPLFSAEDLIYSDDQVYAMISAYQWPNNPGNVVVVPNDHYENIYDLPDPLGARIQAVARRVALAMKAAWKCDGLSTRQHNEPAGNQDTWHFHMHVTPRYTGDNFYRTYMTAKALMPAEKRAAYALDLRQALKRSRTLTDWSAA